MHLKDTDRACFNLQAVRGAGMVACTMEAVVIGQKMAIPSYLGGSFDPKHPKSQRSYSTHVRKGSTNGQQTRAFADGFFVG